jgi:hypothetical protein
MHRPRSATKTIGSSSIGIIPYKVVRINRHRVDIFISNVCARMLCERGADLNSLKHLKGDARDVMKKILSSVEEQ